jgi:hypothetical protein
LKATFVVELDDPLDPSPLRVLVLYGVVVLLNFRLNCPAPDALAFAINIKSVYVDGIDEKVTVAAVETKVCFAIGSYVSGICYPFIP